MVAHVDPSGCLSNENTRLAFSNDEKCGFEVEFELLSTLPDQLLLEILIRLPSESACRFKVVCKGWCSLISSNYFISRYIDHRCQDTPKTFTLVLSLFTEGLFHVKAVSNHPALSKLFEKKSLNSFFERRFKRVYKRSHVPFPYYSLQIFVEASCHDLLLFSDSLTYCVVNLRTMMSIILPPVPRRVGKHSHPHFTCSRKAGLLCYHDQNKTNNGDRWCCFKLILVPIFLDPVKRQDPPPLQSSPFSIDIYCSETRKWSVVNVRWYPLVLKGFVDCSPIIAHDRMLHWINTHSLVSLDPFSSDQQLGLGRAIELPKKRVSYRLGVCCGHIRVAACIYEEGNAVLHVWDLDNKSWLLAHKIVLGKSSLEGDRFAIFAVHPYDTDVIFVRRANLVYLFNMRTDRLEEYHEMKLRKGCETLMVMDKTVVVLHQWFPTPFPSRWPI